MAKRKSTAKKSARPKAKTRKTAKTQRTKSISASARQPTAHSAWLRRERWVFIGLQIATVGLLAVGLISGTEALRTRPQALSEASVRDTTDYNQLRQLSGVVSRLEAAQSALKPQTISTGPLEEKLSMIQVALESNSTTAARSQIAQLRRLVAQDQAAITKMQANQAANPVATAPVSADQINAANVPILLYHKPPSDFDTQMELLQQHSYTTITPDELAGALTGNTTLPAKPIIITFDDGFEDQLSAAQYLDAHKMRATFYIIDGGAASDYCIGANRTKLSCGDSYLTWKQIIQLDHNPLFTIASHTVDHLDLPQQSTETQVFQIKQGKKELEQELGHSVDDFAYPYGDFNATTLQIVQQAGFITAVTTTPGTIQTADALLSLKRIRSTYELP